MQLCTHRKSPLKNKLKLIISNVFQVANVYVPSRFPPFSKWLDKVRGTETAYFF